MNPKQYIYRHWSIVIILFLLPVMLYAILHILPTHDDWAGTTKPDFAPFFVKEHFFFYGYHWRPFDTWIGYIAGRNPQVLYPLFNHILVVAGHVLCSLTVYKLLAVLGFSRTAQNITTLFFFIAPATMATTTAVDSQNQVYALTIDIVAFLAYIKLKKGKYVLWPLLVFLAALFKENGLMWALICPILAFGFDFINKKTLKKDLIAGVMLMMLYALAIVIQPKDMNIHPEYVPSVLKVITSAVKFLFTSFITVDYIWLLHAPSRNLWMAALTLMLALPFFYVIFVRNVRIVKEKKIVCTLIALCIAAAPHVLTVYSMMHTYAGLVMIAIITAHSITVCQQDIKLVTTAFVLFVIAAIIIDVHLIDASIKSGLVGKKMAVEAVQKTDQPADRVYVVIIEDAYPKLSSFCVIPSEAFGWGYATQYETNYRWPKAIQDTTITRAAHAMSEARKICHDKLRHKAADCAWIIDHQNIYVVTK